MPRGVLFWFLPFIFLSTFSVYLLTVNSTFQPDDSDEIVSACVALTTEHPSGYPLHVLLGHLAEYIPLGGVDIRANLLSAGMGALGAVLLALLVLGFIEEKVQKGVPPKSFLKILFSFLPALSIGAFALAFSRSYWLQAMSAKGGIYQMQTCLFIGLLLALQKFLADGPELKAARTFPYILLALFLIGLRFGIGSETQVVLGAALLVSVLVLSMGKCFKTGWSWKGFFLASAVLIVASSVLSLLPLLQCSGRPNIWPLADNWIGFREIVTNSSIHKELESIYWNSLKKMGKGSVDWGELQRAWPALLAQWERYSGHFLGDLGWWFWIPAAMGFYFLYARKKYWILVFSLSFIFFLAGALVVAVYWDPAEMWAIDKFTLPVNVFEALWAGLGVHYLSSWLLETRKSKVSQNGAHSILPLLSLVFILLALGFHFPLNDQSRQRWAYDHAADLMKSLKRNAIFLAEGDNAVFPTLYFQKALGKRADVLLIPVFQFWTPAGMDNLAKEMPELFPRGSALPKDEGERVRYCVSRLIEAEVGKRPIGISPHYDLLYRCYFAGLPQVARDRDLNGLLKPHGLVLEYSSPNGKANGQVLTPIGFTHPPQEATYPTEAMDLLFANWAESYLDTAEYFQNYREWDKGEFYYRSILGTTQNKRFLSETWRGLGDLDWSRGDMEQALSAYKESIQLTPNRESYYQSILLSYRLGRFEGALAFAHDLVLSFPDEPASWYKLAACEEALGDQQKAQLDLQRALGMEKNKRGKPS